MGGQENLELAKSYYEKAIKMSENDTRSLFGLILCCNQLASKSTPSKKKELVNTGIQVANTLSEIYKTATDNAHVDVHLRTINAIKTHLNQLSN